ncbi:MAG: hypothetical protein E7571_00270 [Ruminococcaceae bacterium]|nr:hypothetical protein [Oscillospiraceae bacterium]
MIIYKSNMAGPYHIENGLPCQDSYAVLQSENFCVLAVTDGLGSELYSDIGASEAASSAVNYCSENLSVNMAFEDIKKVMNNALVCAYKAVLERAACDNNDPDEYDTTMCLAVYDGEHLYYAQSGDSGLIALLQNGEYYRVTSQQRDDEGRVYPLCWGPDKWEFGCVKSPVSAFMLMTDGVFEQMCPPIMRNRDIDINVPLARKFMDHFNATENDIFDIEKWAHEYLEHYPRYLLDDDKTILVLINTERKPKEMDEAYYAIPDWESMKTEALEKLYNNSEEPDNQDGERIDSNSTSIESEMYISKDDETLTDKKPISKNRIEAQNSVANNSIGEKISDAQNQYDSQKTGDTETAHSSAINDVKKNDCST